MKPIFFALLNGKYVFVNVYIVVFVPSGTGLLLFLFFFNVTRAFPKTAPVAVMIKRGQPCRRQRLLTIT